MKRLTISLAIAFILFLFHSLVFSKSTVDADTPTPASKAELDSKIVSGLDADWQAVPSPFIQQPGGFALKIGDGRHGQIVFPAVLDSQNPIVIQIQKNKVQQVLASGGTYKAELVGKYLVYRGDRNSILYRYDADNHSLREFVYLKDASALAKDGEVIQWRFEGANLKMQDDGSVALTQTIDIKNEVRKVSNNHMADRISRFLAKRRGTPEQPGRHTRTLFTIPKPEYIDGHGKTLTEGIQYKISAAQLTLHLDSKSPMMFPLWVDPSLQFRADADANVILNGQDADDQFGSSISSAGDFNGDGLDDVIVGTPNTWANGNFQSGSSYIFFGQNSTGQANLRANDDADIIIDGQNWYDGAGYVVSSVGDFNGDGLDDIAIGGNWNGQPGGGNNGSVYIFLGRNPESQLNLRTETHANIIINNLGSGLQIDSAGDFNGDGFDDLIVGSASNTSFGSAFLFFGQNPTSQLTLTNSDANISILGQHSFDSLGSSVSSAGDFNGDGLNDVIIGATSTDTNELDSGSAYIFFGQNPTGSLSLRAHDDADIIMNGQNRFDRFGSAVGSAGDFNGDGLNDVIVGVLWDDNNGLGQSGSAFIFFGQNSTIQLILEADTDANIILDGQNAEDHFGISVSTAGDFNNDGLDDVIVGAFKDDNNGLSESGSAFMFFGRNPSAQLILRADVDADIILDGQSAGDFFGDGLSNLGDFNGDGIDDIVVAAKSDDNSGLTDSGSAFIFFGQNFLPVPKNDVVLNLPGSGVSVLLNNNSSSVVLHGDTAEAIATADVDNNGQDDVIVSFPAESGPDGAGGTYISRNQEPLTLLDSKTAERIVVGNFDGIGGDDLFLDFGTDGLWSYLNDTTLSLFDSSSTVAMAVGDVDNNGQDDLIYSIAGQGTFIYQNFTAPSVTLDNSAAEMLVTGDIDGNGEDDIAASFTSGNGPGGTGGLFIARNQGALSLLTTSQVQKATRGDFDGSGQDDLVFDFGGSPGLVVYLNDASTMFLTTMSPTAMTSGDVDSSGQDDLIISFTGVGTAVFKDLTTVEIWDPANVALDLATGNVDGN